MPKLREPEPIPADITQDELHPCWVCGYFCLPPNLVVRDDFTAEYLAEMTACDPEGGWEEMTPGIYYEHADMWTCLVHIAYKMAAYKRRHGHL